MLQKYFDGSLFPRWLFCCCCCFPSVQNVCVHHFILLRVWTPPADVYVSTQTQRKMHSSVDMSKETKGIFGFRMRKGIKYLDNSKTNEENE